MTTSTIRSLLERKGYRVVSTGPRASLLDAVRKMSDERVGSLVVFGLGGVAGIITWHDVLRTLGDRGGDLAGLTVEDVMTSPVVTTEPDADLADLAALMVERGIRHVPVVDGRAVVGVVSRIDALSAVLEVVDDFSEELWRYIAGVP